MKHGLILVFLLVAAVAATRPATSSSAKPQAESKGAPNPAAVATDASSERGPAATTTTTKRMSPKSSSTTRSATQPESKPVPLLSAQEAIETFNLPPGFRAEVVAAEPLVQQPVAMEFDPDGRLWVVEMRGYMPTAEGTGEDEPNGR